MTALSPRCSFSGTALKTIACITMLVDHIGASCIEAGILTPGLDIGTLSRDTLSAYPLYRLDRVLRFTGRLAFPLVTLRLEEYPNRKDFLAALAARITAEKAEAVVMGLPLLDDGTDSLTTRQVRNVTERLKRRVDLPVFYMPELLSSEEAWSDLRDAGLTARKRKAVLDQQAAVRILASFLALPPEQRRPA